MRKIPKTDDEYLEDIVTEEERINYIPRQKLLLLSLKEVNFGETFYQIDCYDGFSTARKMIKTEKFQEVKTNLNRNAVEVETGKIWSLSEEEEVFVVREHLLDGYEIYDLFHKKITARNRKKRKK